MSLAEFSSIDIIFLSPDKSKVSLVAVDGGEISDPAEREEALQNKLKAYLQFVSSGQFIDAYTEHADRGVDILVVCTTPPTENMNAIEGIRDPDQPGTFLPVSVMTHEQFRTTLREQAPRRKAGPWWKFWSR